MRLASGLTCIVLTSTGLAGCGDDGRPAAETSITATNPTAATGITSVSGTSAPGDSEPGTTAPTTSAGEASGQSSGEASTGGPDTSAATSEPGTTTVAADCVDDPDCPVGTICDAGACVPGCSDSQPCAGGLACCAAACIDLLTDPAHCGGCDAAPCPAPAHASAVCSDGMCGVGDCDDGFTNCDGDLGNGCEVEGDCQCTPGEQVACYSGPMGTQDVGVCKAGLQTCNPQGTGFGPCMGEVLPGPVDLCANGLDDNCDGKQDEDPDADKDGWTVCGGDCCDAVGPSCLNPELVNPGAFEVPGNTVDDDCDGNQDNPLAACDGGLPSNSADPLQYAKAIDLCQFTVEQPPQKDKKWGVISGAFTRSNNAGSPAAAAKSIRDGFGASVKPLANTSLAALSTGHAADTADKMPAFAAFQGGTDLGTDAAVPSDWLALNNNNFPNVQGCPEPQGGNTGNDTIQLKLRIRVPTNALSFSTKIYFFSSEYPEWVCSAFNDFFVTLVDSAGAGNPSDKNIAVYKDGQNKLFPVGVNLVKTANGLFTQCKNGETGCGGGAVPGNYIGCVGNSELVGTGFDPQNPQPQFPGDPGYCGGNNQVGGGTGWLKMAGNVKPGETMELRFTIWDTGDGFYDSVVLLDDFQWSVQASQPGVQPN